MRQLILSKDKIHCTSRKLLLSPLSLWILLWEWMICIATAMTATTEFIVMNFFRFQVWWLCACRAAECTTVFGCVGYAFLTVGFWVDGWVFHADSRARWASCVIEWNANAATRQLIIKCRIHQANKGTTTINANLFGRESERGMWNLFKPKKPK